MKRVFLIGNGVSMDVAETPSSRKLIPEMIDYFRKESVDDRNKGRINCFVTFFAFLHQIGNNLRRSNYFPEEYRKIMPADNNIFSENYVFNDIEVLLSLIELNLISPPILTFNEPGVTYVPFKGSFFPNFEYSQLKDIESGIKTYLFELLRPDKVKDKTGVLKKFCEKFIQKGDCVITLNYDLLIEQALWEVDKWTPNDGYMVGKVRDENYLSELKKCGRIKSQVILLKLHGSLNWEKDNNIIKIDLHNRENGKSYFRGLKTIGDLRCNGKYKGRYDFLTIMPSYVKLFPSSEIRKLWNMAAQQISSADEIYIIGYSLPKADMLVDFLVSFINPKSKVIIINPDAEKLKNRMIENYGKLNIIYFRGDDDKPITFKQFVNQNLVVS